MISAEEGESGPQGDMPPSGAISITKEPFAGWSNSYRLRNGLIEAVVVADVGPRIMELRRSAGSNLFYVREAEAGGTNESEWKFRGGWRLWIAPERTETTYDPDNTPCGAEIISGKTLRVTGPVQPVAGIRKRIDVTPAEGEPRLRVSSRIENVTDKPLTYAAWSLSAMRPGGRAFVPLDVGPLTAFDAIRRVILWSYAEMSDARYRWGDRLIEIDHSRVSPPPSGQSGRRDDESKIGVDSTQGWAAYLLGGTLYLKRFPHDASGQYPDGGATIEVYSSHEFLEVEHLGPLTTIAPGEEIVFDEDWWVFPDARVLPGETEALSALLGYVARTKGIHGPSVRDAP
jgi:hypothetical protein